MNSTVCNNILSCGLIKKNKSWIINHEIKTMNIEKSIVKDISVGEDRIAVISSTSTDIHQIYCFANLNYLILNNGECYFHKENVSNHFENKCIIPKGQSLKQLSFCIGNNTVYFLTDEQYLFELYFGETGDIRKTEVGGIRIKILQCGNNHILLIDNYNKLYSFGLGSRGQLGHGFLDDESKPRIIESLSHLNVISISCGAWHSLCICDSGKVYSWGWNDCGQLGLQCCESSEDEVLSIYTTPCIVTVFSSISPYAIAIQCGQRHSLILDSNYYVWGFGLNKHSQLGISQQENIRIPTPIIKNVRLIRAGRFNSVFIMLN